MHSCYLIQFLPVINGGKFIPTDSKILCSGQRNFQSQGTRVTESPMVPDAARPGQPTGRHSHQPTRLILVFTSRSSCQRIQQLSHSDCGIKSVSLPTFRALFADRVFLMAPTQPAAGTEREVMTPRRPIILLIDGLGCVVV
jgi:hypothetical protein